MLRNWRIPHIIDKQYINNLLPVFKYQSIKDSFLSFLKEQEAITKQKEMQCKEPMTDSQFKDFYDKLKTRIMKMKK